MLQHSLDPFSLFVQAGPVVKTVVVLLVLSSIWCWAIVLDCTVRLARLRSAIAQTSQGQDSALLNAVLQAGREQAHLHFKSESPDARHERVVGVMRRRVQETVERHQGGLSNLAVISSVAPFVGLFGTVWGIMTSFIGIASAQDTSLAVVAPGIAEALGATAIGLAAAIPAAFFYNRLAAGYTRAGRAMSRAVEDRAVSVLYDSTPLPTTR
jgi:biopolymer transport protein ExbB/TolQ